MSKSIPSPEKFFGFKMGADRKLARWDKIVEYYHLLGKLPTIKVTEIGKSTVGNPFLLVLISSAENIKNIDKIREMSYKIAHPKDLSEDDVERIFRDGKTVVAMGLSMHATEVGGTQMGPELAYELATRPEYEETRRNTVLAMVPCINPDGEIWVTDYYNKCLGTEYEGTNLPWLYHKYTGHDNNRDAFFLQQVEAQMLAHVLYKEWYPQAYVDQHHMGSYGARFYVTPLCSPLNENVDPLVWVEQQLYGGMQTSMLEAAGKTGVESAVTYRGFLFAGFDYAPCWYGICAMLTESASANIATPIYVHKQQLQGSKAGRPENRIQMGFPHPWPGGWWRLRDVVEQQKIAGLAILRVASNFREMILKNMYMKANRSIEAGLKEPPYAFIVEPGQHDELSTYKFLEVMDRSGVEISRASEGFAIDGVTYPAGTHVIFTSQICRPFLISVLRQTQFYDGPFARNPDGSPQVFDSASNTVHELMGVKLREAKTLLEGKFEKIKSVSYPEGVVEESGNGYILDGRITENYAGVNDLLKAGANVQRVLEPVKSGGRVYETGSFYVPSQPTLRNELKKVSTKHHLKFVKAPSGGFKTKQLKAMRVGMYQRFLGGNMDEGWTRWLLEKYGFPYTTIKDEDFKKGNLNDNFDVIIFPEDSTQLITGEGLEEYSEALGRPMATYPPEYRSGIGKEGVESVKKFVEAGGSLVSLGEASNFAISTLKLPLKNAIAGLKPIDFFCSGSTLRVKYDKSNPIAYGISDDALILYRNQPAFELKTTPKNDDVSVVAFYPDAPERILESGWLIGEKYLRDKAALVEVKKGEGRAVLFGFSPQSRAQTYATFKLFFNCLIN